MRIKGLTAERMERLRRFTRSLNAELALMGGEPLDVLEAHEECQGLIDGHEGTWADLVRRIAAEGARVSYVEAGEEATRRSPSSSVSRTSHSGLLRFSPCKHLSSSVPSGLSKFERGGQA
jgi:hypothetical protein